MHYRSINSRNNFNTVSKIKIAGFIFNKILIKRTVAVYNEFFHSACSPQPRGNEIPIHQRSCAVFPGFTPCRAILMSEFTVGTRL
jgi:hypothetical protein